MSLLILAAGMEVVTALVLMVDSSLFTRLLFAGEMSAAGQSLGRLAGFALLSLALACWPSRGPSASEARSVRAMLLFSVLCAVYLAFRGFRGGETGPLLWPAAAAHAVLAALLARALFRSS